MFVLSPAEWANEQFATVQLGDIRRTPRAVDMATRMMRNPSASLPQQMGHPAALKAAYRLLNEEEVTFAALLQPHWDRTRAAAGHHSVVLFVQDTTHVDYTQHPKTTDLGPIGDGRGQGFLLQTVLAVVPAPRQVLGIAQQEPFLRQPALVGETRAERLKRPRESQAWTRAVTALGRPPRGSQWIHVGDRYSDIFDFLATCREQACDMLVRAGQNRRIVTPQGRATHLFSFARGLAAQDERTLPVPAHHGHPARDAQVRISFSPVTLRPPHRGGTGRAALRLWVVRVWEVGRVPKGEQRLEWILLTSVAVETLDDAWERVEWYRCRWLIEDYHQCLKTGCNLEQRQLQEGPDLFRILGFLSPIAVRLLQLREWARLNPDQLAHTVLPKELVAVIALLAQVPADSLTVGAVWRHIAQQGGYQGRRGDGPPGWQTLWRGWLYVQTLLDGVQLAAQLPP